MWGFFAEEAGLAVEQLGRWLGAWYAEKSWEMTRAFKKLTFWKNSSSLNLSDNLSLLGYQECSLDMLMLRNQEPLWFWGQNHWNSSPLHFERLLTPISKTAFKLQPIHFWRFGYRKTSLIAFPHCPALVAWQGQGRALQWDFPCCYYSLFLRQFPQILVALMLPAGPFSALAGDDG